MCLSVVAVFFGKAASEPAAASHGQAGGLRAAGRSYLASGSLLSAESNRPHSAFVCECAGSQGLLGEAVPVDRWCGVCDLRSGPRLFLTVTFLPCRRLLSHAACFLSDKDVC